MASQDFLSLHNDFNLLPLIARAELQAGRAAVFEGGGTKPNVGSPGRIRTSDQPVNSRLLYR